MRPWTRRRLERQAVKEAPWAFVTARAAVAEPHPPPVKRKRWADRASEELDAALELDLQPDREKRRRYVPSYERVANHLKERGFE